MDELHGLEECFTPVGDSLKAPRVTRRFFIGAGMTTLALPLLLGSQASSAALLGRRKCESTLRFAEDRDGLTVSWYPELELDLKPHDLSNIACAPPPKPTESDKPHSTPPDKAQSWRLSRKAFGPDAKFRLRLDKSEGKLSDIIYTLEVYKVRFGSLAERSLQFKFSHYPTEKSWKVQLLTAMWSDNEKRSQLLDFSELSVATEDVKSSPAKSGLENMAIPPGNTAFELERVDATLALKSVFGDDLRVKGALRFLLASNGVWSIQSAGDKAQKNAALRLADSGLSLPEGFRMAWCDTDPASLDSDAASNLAPYGAGDREKDKTQKVETIGYPEKDPVFVAWGNVSESDLLLGAGAKTPRIMLTALKIKARDSAKQADTQSNENRTASNPSSGAASSPLPSPSTANTTTLAAPALAKSPRCAMPEPSVDLTTLLGNPSTSPALDKPPRWRFVRRDWSLRDSQHPPGVSSVRAAWLAQVWTTSGRFGPLPIADGVFQRALDSKSANTPMLRFAGQLSTTSWDLDTCIGRLFVKGAATDGSAVDVAKASARTHHPLMTLSSPSFVSPLSSLHVPLLLLRSDLAPEGCEFSELNFAPTGLRAVYDIDDTKALNDLQVSDSYLWLGESSAIRGLPLAHIDLTRARLDVARPNCLARLGFMFAGLHLDIISKKAWITDARASCPVRQRIEPSGNGEPIILDTRSVLVAEFPPQHVFEEVVFRPSEAPLPDVALKMETKTFPVKLRGSDKERTFSTSLPDLVRELEDLDCVEDHETVRRAYAAMKADEAKQAGEGTHFGDFVNEFERLCKAGMAKGSLPSSASPSSETPKCSPRLKNDSLPTAYWVYIGPEGLSPELMAIGRQANKTIRNTAINALLNESLRKAERFIALLGGAPPEPDDLKSKIFDVVKAVVAAMNPFKGTPQLPLAERDRARMLEQAASGTMQDYAYFRDFYAEWMLEKHGEEELLPEDLEFFSPNNQTGLESKDKTLLQKRFTDAKEAYVARLQGMQDPEPVMRARLSSTSRLAFYVDCGSRPGLDVESGDAHVVSRGDTPGTRLPFSFDALTDWAHYDLAVTPRARQAASFDEAGVLIRREDSEEGGSEDDSLGADIAMLKSLGIRSGQVPLRDQRQARARDWGKKLRTLQERLSDVEASLSVVPNDLQTSIEIPSRLILSPSQKGQWRTQRDNLPWDCAPSRHPVPLWTANLEVDTANPLVRAVASPDMRPEFVRFGLERSLFGYQREKSGTDALHSPVGAAPPRGPRAPWTLGFEESDPNTSSIEQLFKATQTVPTNVNPTEKDKEDICADSAAARASLAVSSPSAESSAQPSENNVDAFVSLHPLLEYLCARQIDRKGYGKNAVFRSTLDAYDRHEIVLLSSAWGLPVRGRREKTGQLQALRFSSQIELPEEWRLLDAQAGTAVYRPRALKVRELALTALGGTLRHDSDFVPPTAARHIIHGPLFDSMSVERWQHWTVLGRDVFAEVVYKGYLFPIGHRASLVKQTERIFLRPAKTSERDPDTPLRCYLRQRMFIRVARPEKAFPAYGQPNGGRMFPAGVVRMLTLTTPDIVDPAEDTKGRRAENNKEEEIPTPAGRLYADEAGLVFWPRTARLAGAEVVFDMQVQDASTRGKLIFVDNVAVNRPDLMERLVHYYNKQESPDITQDNQPFLQTPDLHKHLRTFELHGQSLRYCDEIKPGSASHKTLSWTVKASGGVGVTNIPRGPNEIPPPVNDFEGPVQQFDDPLLEGADQPPFFPAIETARIRIDQVERLTGAGPQIALAQFEGWYVQNGFAPNKRTQESDELGVYVNIVNKVTMDMGISGDRSGGVMRPGGEVIALSRQRGPLTGTSSRVKAGIIASVVGKDGFPLMPPEEKPQKFVGGKVSNAASRQHAQQSFNKFFDGDQTLNTKILGLVSVKDLVTYLDVKNAAAELPLLREVVEYGMSGAQGAAEDLRTKVVAPLYQLVLDLDRQWEAAGKQAQAKSDGFVSGMADIFPDVHNALQDLKNVLSASSANTDDAAVLASLSEIYECGRRLMDACGRVAANPLDQMHVAVKRKLEGLNTQVDTFYTAVRDLDLKKLKNSASLTEFDKRLLDGAYARLHKLEDKLKAFEKELDKKETVALDRVVAVRKVFEGAWAQLTKVLQDTVDGATSTTVIETPFAQAQKIFLSQLMTLDTALKTARPQLNDIKVKSKDAAIALRGLTAALDVVQWRTAEAVTELRSPVVLAQSEYQRGLTSLTTLLRFSTLLRGVAGTPQSQLTQVSQLLFDYLMLQVGPRLPNFPPLDEARGVISKVLEPIKDSAKKTLKRVVSTELVFPEELPYLTKKDALDAGKWPVTGRGDTLVDKLHLVAIGAHVALTDSKLKDPKFDPVREQLAGVGKTALAAQKDLHRAAVSVQLLTEGLTGLDEIRIQVSMQEIDSAFRELQKLGESAVDVIVRLRDDLLAISLEDTQKKLKQPVKVAFLSILDWFGDLTAAAALRLPSNETLIPLVAPWKSLLTEYRQAISKTRAFIDEASIDRWLKEPSALVPVLRNPIDVAENTGAQAVFILQRVVVDQIMDWVAGLVEPSETVVEELMTAFRPLIVLLEKAYTELNAERENVFKAAGETAGQLLTGALLVRVDRNVLFVPGERPKEAETDGSRSNRDQLHWDVQSMRNLLKFVDGKLPSSVRGQALNFMEYLATGWRTGQSTPLRIVAQFKRISLEEIRARLLALINFGAIREEIEERIKLLIPSAMTLSYDFSTTMSAEAEKATAGVFRPKEGCALSVRTRARVDLLKPNAPTFLSIGELGAFDIRLLGSFDAVTLHFKGVRFTSRGGAPECDLQYDGFTIGKEMEYLSQLTPFFGSKAGSGFYLQPLSSGIGLEAGYGLNLGTFSVGNLAIFNVSLNAAARLPFDNRGATFVASLSRRDSPFTIAIAPYGGSGFFALEADTTGIVGFEASFEYGGAGAFAYGPLTGQGRLMVGAYIRSRRDHTEIFATFYVGGSASIWIFNFGASLYVTAKQEGRQMKGSATYTFSFSMGIVDYDYKVGVNVTLSLDGSKGEKSQEQADKTVTGTASRWQDETVPIRLASLEAAWSPSGIVSDVATLPLSMMAAAATTATAAKQKTGVSTPPTTAKRRIATKCQTQSWTTYSNYFDQGLAKKVLKKGY